jgi:hypothetical protein
MENNNTTLRALRENVLESTKEFASRVHDRATPVEPCFEPGQATRCIAT